MYGNKVVQNLKNEIPTLTLLKPKLSKEYECHFATIQPNKSVQILTSCGMAAHNHHHLTHKFCPYLH